EPAPLDVLAVGPLRIPEADDREDLRDVEAACESGPAERGGGVGGDDGGGDAGLPEGVEQLGQAEVGCVEGDGVEPGGGHRGAVAGRAVLDGLVAGELVDEDDA